jgi:hypothetical protein
VLELLFSAPLVAVLRTLEPSAIGYCRSERASRTSKTSYSLRSSATLDSDVPILDLDGPPPETGGPPHFVCHYGSHSSGTSSSPPFVHIYMSSSPLCKSSHLTTTLYSSVPITPHDDGVVNTAPSQGRTRPSSSWPRDGTHPSIHDRQIPRCRTFNALIVVSNVVDPNRRTNARLNTTRTSSSGTITRRLLLNRGMPMPLKTIFEVSETSL